MANDKIKIETKAGLAIVDDRLPALDMYKASIREYEAKVKAASNPVEKSAFEKVLKALKEDIKRFAKEGSLEM